MALHSIVLTAWVLLLGATVPCFAEEAPKQTFTCTAKTFNECLMEAPCSAWKQLGPKGYKLETKIIFRGNPVEAKRFRAARWVISSKRNAERSRIRLGIEKAST